jgi:hypothetical protein
MRVTSFIGGTLKLEENSRASLPGADPAEALWTLDDLESSEPLENRFSGIVEEYTRCLAPSP